MIRKKVLETIKKYNLIEPHDKIVLGVSGGPDSITMLILLNELKTKFNFEIVVAHINHGIRDNAVSDEEYVKKWCQKIGVEFYCLHAKVKDFSKEQKLSLEDAGRRVRYEFFNKILKETNSNKIAIAHNKNDNSETVIMNILRGSGINGLRGIEPKQGIYIRPLVECSRLEIEQFCELENVNPRIDESNFENEFTRNKIRNIILPYIKENFNPNIIDNLERLTNIAREEENYINNQAKKSYTRICEFEKNLFETDDYNKFDESRIGLNLKQFNSFDKIIQKKIILISIQKIFGTVKGIEKIHLDDIIKLCNNNIGNKYLTPNKNLKIVIKNKKINIISIK